MILNILISILSVLFGLYTFKIFILRRKYAHIPGPPANGLIGFYFGNFYEVAKYRASGKIAPDLTVQWLKKYGKTIKFQVGSSFMIVTVDPKAIKEITIEKNFPKNQFLIKAVAYPYGERYSGRGLFSDFDIHRWKHRRAIYNPSFNKSCLLEFVNEFNSTSDLLLEKLRSLADGKTVVSMHEMFSLITLDIISHVAFGIESEGILNSNTEFIKIVNESFVGVMNYLRVKFIPILRLFPNEIIYSFKYKQIAGYMRNYARDHIVNRMKQIQDGLYTPPDLLNAIIKTSSNQNEDIEDMIDDFVTFYLAGHETTANALAFCFLELGKNPRVVNKLREEVDRVLGSRNEVTNDDLINLKYISCVVKETLRLWSPANGTVREVPTNDFKIDNLNIPKGSIIHVGSYFTSRNDDFFPDPLEFKPERFESETYNAYAYSPFSLGPRNCIGQNFAKIEMKIIIAKLIKNFEFKLVENQNLGAVEYFTFKPTDGAKFYISLRNN